MEEEAITEIPSTTELAGDNANNDNISNVSLVTNRRPPPLSKLIIVAICMLNKRSGSSVNAIGKYIKSIGYEVKDDRTFTKAVHMALKKAISKGKVMQVKRSFKLTDEEKSQSKSQSKSKSKKTGHKNGTKKSVRDKSKNSTNTRGTKGRSRGL